MLSWPRPTCGHQIQLLRATCHFAAASGAQGQDQREVLEYLAEGFTVEEVWRDLASVNLAASASDPVDTTDFATAIRHTGCRIALVTASDELRDILDKPFAAWRVYLHPSQYKVAYRASYSGPAQVTGGPGTGKTVVALHRIKHLLTFLRDGDRVLLTTYTNALAAALRAGLATLVDDEELLAHRARGWPSAPLAAGPAEDSGCVGRPGWRRRTGCGRPRQGRPPSRRGARAAR